MPYNLADLQGCLSVFEHLMQPNLQPAVPGSSADAQQAVHQMLAYAQNSNSHGQHPLHMPSSVHLEGAQAASADNSDHMFGTAADASAMPAVHATSLALSSPIPSSDSVLRTAKAAHIVCGSQQQQSVNFSHLSAQHSLQHAAQLGSENVSMGITAPTLGDPPSGLAAASPAFSALLSAPSPSAMLLSPAPEFSPLAAIPELCVPSPPAPCIPCSLPSATALLDATSSAAHTGQLLASTASLISQVPAAQVMLQQPHAAGMMQAHCKPPPNAAQPSWEQSAAAVMLSSGHPGTAAMPHEAAAPQAALTSVAHQIAAPSSSISTDNPASAAPSFQLERAGSFRQSHKRKPDKRKRTVAAATTAEPPAQRQKPDKQRGVASVAPISQGLQQQAVAADDAQPVRRSSRPRKVTSAAKESAEQAEGYCQPRASSRSKALKVRLLCTGPRHSAPDHAASGESEPSIDLLTVHSQLVSVSACVMCKTVQASVDSSVLRVLLDF